ncbi:MAG: hypothetical protein EXS68_00650 [Candidatus Ryanbacteria bacterium]|nr:hypothetical protein [Candidatus Ryanbacteria bacterium]
MNQDVLLLAVVVIGLLAVAHFTTLGGGIAGGVITPLNPKAEFGVIRMQESILRGPRGSTGTTPPPTITLTPPPAVPQDILARSFALSTRNAKSRNINEEYVEIVYAPTKNAAPVDISDWMIADSKGESYKLGGISLIPGISSLYNQDRLILRGSARIHVVTGRSPLGENFRLNKCAPYFSQYKTFTPRISDSCPSPSREPGQDSLSDTCYQYIKTISACRIPTNIPFFLDNTCREFIQKNASYDACVKNHKSDTDFYGDEYWVYLNRPEHIWSDIRDSVILKDARGSVVKAISYQ